MKYLIRVPEELLSALREVSLQELDEEVHICRHDAGPHYLRAYVWYFVIICDAADMPEV